MDSETIRRRESGDVVSMWCGPLTSLQDVLFMAMGTLTHRLVLAYDVTSLDPTDTRESKW